MDAKLSNPVVHQSWVRIPATTQTKNKGADGPFVVFGGEGGIRTPSTLRNELHDFLELGVAGRPVARKRSLMDG